MGDLKIPSSKAHVWIDAAMGFAIVLALTAFVVLTGVGGLLVVWCLPIGVAIGSLVRPISGVLSRVVALLAAAYCAYRAYPLVGQLDSPQRPYVFALALVVMAGAAAFANRRQDALVKQAHEAFRRLGVKQSG